MSITLGELAARLDAQLHGSAELRVERVAGLDRAGAGDLSFLCDPAYRRFLKITAATAVIVSAADVADCPVATLAVRNPYLAYARATAMLHPLPAVAAGVHPSAWVSPDARVAASARVGPKAVVEAGACLGEAVDIGAGCFVGAGAFIGDYSRLGPNVTVWHGVRIGRRCILYSGAVIGADGFGLARDADRWVRVPQIGGVQLGDDVEIGANSTVDRGALGDTLIEDGVKIDNLVQIGHNCRIGAHTAIAGCVGISGSAKIGRRCMIGGGTGINGHIEIADDVQITGMSMITKSISQRGSYSGGWPARDSRYWRRLVARVHRLAGGRAGRDND